MNGKLVDYAAGIAVPGWLVSIFASTLPIVQWCAGVVAIVVGLLAIWRHFFRRE